MIYLSSYIATPDVNVIQSILRNGFDNCRGIKLNSWEPYSLHDPTSGELFTNEALGGRLSRMGVNVEWRRVDFYRLDPIHYHPKFDRWVTKDYLTERLEKTIKIVESGGAVKLISTAECSAEEPSLTYRIPFRYINGDRYEFDVRSRKDEDYPIQQVWRGFLIHDDVFHALGELDYPFWFACPAVLKT